MTMRAANDDTPDAAKPGAADDLTAGLTPAQLEEGKARAAAFKRSLDLKPLPKRFYTDATIAPVQGGAFAIHLDQRRLMTPRKARLLVQTKVLAEAIADEWNAQGDRIDAARMPMTRLANTAVDRVSGREHEIVAEITAFAESDLLCYRAETPQGLVSRQAKHWDPVLTWAADELRAKFMVTAGVMFANQPPEALAAVRQHVTRFDAAALTGLHNMTTLTGSCLLALATACHYLPSDVAWQTAHVDEDWQISQWGEDAEAAARRAYRQSEFAAAVRFLELSQNANA